MALCKRKRSAEDDEGRNTNVHKKVKTLGKDHFDKLSDEIVLRILSFLPILDLTRTERVCKKVKRLAIDNALWREKFYGEFVFPRMRRLPSLAGLEARERDEAALAHASRLARRQEQSEKHSQKIDWKHRFKVKLNWSKGRCTAHEVSLDLPPQPRLLVRVINGVTVTASEKGLRVYCQQKRPQLPGSFAWSNSQQWPTALSACIQRDQTMITVGFNDGHIGIYALNDEHQFSVHSSFDLSHGSAITDLATTWPYLLVLCKKTVIKLVEIRRTQEQGPESYSATTLADLQSIAAISLTSLSLRQVSSTLIASVAYPFHRINAGYCLGIQEIRMRLSGEVINTRLASTIETPMQDLPFRKPSKILTRAATTAPFPLHPQLMHLPNSISHSGCYILAGLPDNTLMVYTVTSTAEHLEISAGRRLWGHTSSISGTQVSDRGKALSVSVKGDEIRIWELEDILSAYSLRSTSTALKPQLDTHPLTTAIAMRGDGVGLAIEELKNELSWTRHWIGFDDEQVVVLGERDQRQILSCFSFT